jgi:ABC-2 type transport system ATP-binding protein
MLENAIEITNVSRSFGTKRALDQVSLTVPSGTVMGLVGENGAGKTTLIKHVMGLMRPQEGTVRVLGGDPVADPEKVLSQVGYLTEEVDLPVWMTVQELMRYTETFYATWDAAYANRLREEFGLDPRSKLRTLSKGQRARAGLMAALAYRPALLVLDEPSSGLDPIVRRDILGAIIRTIAEEGRTVLFSSHLLAEVERVSDRVAMIRQGKIIFSDTLDAIKESHYRLTLRFQSAQPLPPRFDGALGWTGAGAEWTTVCCGAPSQIEASAAVVGAKVVSQTFASLDEIFVARTGAGARSLSEAAHVEQA